MPSIGEILRAARTTLELDLDEVSSSTRINPKYLRAMEADDRSAFPGSFFYRSFVLQYAKKLQLDEKEMAAELDRILASEAPLPLPGQVPAGDLKKITPLVARESSFLSGLKILKPVGSFVLVLAACTGLYAWWRSVNQEAPAPRVAVAQADHVAKPKPAEPPPANPAPQQQAVETAAAPATQPASTEPKTEAASTQPESTPPAENTRLSLNVAASETTWLSLSSDGKPVFRGILQAKETKTVGAVERAKLVVGNAGGVLVEWNGKQIGPLGKRGQVRVVTFTPDKYTFLDAAENRPPDNSRFYIADSTK